MQENGTGEQGFTSMKTETHYHSCTAPSVRVYSKASSTKKMNSAAEPQKMKTSARLYSLVCSYVITSVSNILACHTKRHLPWQQVVPIPSILLLNRCRASLTVKIFSPAHSEHMSFNFKEPVPSEQIMSQPHVAETHRGTHQSRLEFNILSSRVAIYRPMAKYSLFIAISRLDGYIVIFEVKM